MIVSGHPEDRLLRMDLPAFGALIRSHRRLEARKRIETAWTSMIAAQAEGKEMKKWLDNWRPELEADLELTGNDVNAFLSRFGTSV